MAEAEDAAGSVGAGGPRSAGAAKPGTADAEKQAAIVANRQRMQAMMGKKKR